MRTAALFGCAMAAVSLGGCAAALIPVAASGMIGGKSLRHRHGATPADSPRNATTQVAATAPTSIPAPIAPKPADLAQMAPGQVYAGGLPAPDGGGSTPVAPRATAAAATWSDLVHYVAARNDASADSVLVAQHVAGSPPQWVPCGAKPRAVIVDPAANPDGRGDAYIEALRTLDYAIVFTSPRPQASDPYFAKAGQPSHRLAHDDAFVQLTPGAEGAARARVAAKYCVVAIAGRTAADFPDGMMPGAPGAIPGWFAITGP